MLARSAVSRVQHWDISIDAQRDALELVRSTLEDPSATPREHLAAAKVAVLMESKNIQRHDDADLFRRVIAQGTQYQNKLRARFEVTGKRGETD